MLVQNDLTDEELLLKIKQNDYKAFTIIYNRNWNFLYHSAYNILRHHHDALDVCQSIFIWLWENRANIIIKTNLKGYLYTAVKYKAANLMRSNNKICERLADNADLMNIRADEFIMAEVKELKSLIAQLVKQLPPKCCEIFRMSREQNLTHKEIAKQLNISEKTVDEQINRALKKLRLSLHKIASLFMLL